MSEAICFALWAFLLFAGVFFVLFRALFIPQKQRDSSDNLSILRAQLGALQNQKSAGFLTQAEFLEEKADLEKRVMEESQASESPKVFQPAVVTAWILLFILPLLTLFLYFLWGNPSALNLELRDPIAFNQKRFIAALKENPKDEVALANILTLSTQLQNAGEIERALAVLNELKQFNIENAELLRIHAGILWSKTGSFNGEAFKMLERASAIEPNHPHTLLFLGYAFLEKGDITRAEEFLLKAKTQNNDPRMISMIENTLADIKIRKGDFSKEDEDAAIVQIIALKDKILKDAPTSQSMAVLLILGKAAHNLRQYDLALEIFTAAKAAIPTNDAQLQAIVAGTLWRNNKNSIEAKKLLESAKTIAPENPWVLFYEALLNDNVHNLKITDTMPHYLREEIAKLQNPR